MKIKISPNSYSSLRAAENKVSNDFYQSLADKVLLLIAKLERGDISRQVQVSNIKEMMGINFHALAKVLETLIIEEKIDYDFSNGEEANVDNLTIDDLSVRLTEKGEDRAKSIMYSLQRYEN